MKRHNSQGGEESWLSDDVEEKKRTHTDHYKNGITLGFMYGCIATFIAVLVFHAIIS